MEDLELTRFHWENAKQDNINIMLCDKRIAEFPEEVKVETPKKE